MTENGIQWHPPSLAGRVAVVTGASRGVGRGIALALGDAGMKVYVTGRSHRGEPTTEGLPGSIDDTAEEVTARGGEGVPVRCDHTAEDDTTKLFDLVRGSDGRLDLLVNNAWSGYERWPEAKFDAPFWHQPAWRWDLFFGSLRGQYLAAQMAVPLMIPNAVGLIANVSFTDGDVFLGQTAYDVCKAASDRMVVGLACELRKHGVAAVAVHPGFVRTERVDAAWDLLGKGPAQVVHSPEYVGRGLTCLLADPDVLSVTGRRLTVGGLAQKYGFTDTDGRQVPPFKLEGRITLASRMERLNRAVTVGQNGPAR